MYYYIYLSVKAIIKFVITVNFKEFSTRQLLMAMFGFITIKLPRILNITIRVSIKSVTIQQRYILNLLCDIFSFTSVWVYFMILWSLNNYFPLFTRFYYLKNKRNFYLLYICTVCQCVPYFCTIHFSKPQFWLKITSVMSTLLYIHLSHMSNIHLQYMF
jgi:hypothetical protein